MMRALYQRFILISVVLYIAASLLGLYTDVLNTDGINWHTRSNNFVQAILNGSFEKTYQSYHPGITLMWVSGPILHALGNVLTSKGYAFYSYDTYLIYDYAAKLSVILVTAGLFAYALWVLQKLLGKRALIFFSVLMIFEPFILGQRRLYHLDYLMTILIFCSFLSVYYYAYKQPRPMYLFMSAFLFVWGVLTKSSGVIFAPIPFLVLLVSSIKFKHKIFACLLFVVFSLITLYATFPALWKSPIRSAIKITLDIKDGAIDIGYLGKKEVGFAGSKKNTTLDEVTRNGSYDYYFKALFYTLSPVALIILVTALIWFSISIIGKTSSKLNVFSILSVVVFFIVMSISNKKGLRYGVVFFPFLFLIMSGFLETLNRRLYTSVVILFLATLIPQYLQVYPYFYAYADPLLGGVKSRVEIFKPGSLGVATYAVDQKIKADLKTPNSNYKISANKSLKVINKKGVVETSFNCSNDYIVSYYLDEKPTGICSNKYDLLSVVRVGNLDYWEIYRRDVK